MSLMRETFVMAALFLAAVAGATGAQANFIISKAPTQNVSCSNGLCVPIGRDPVLNVGDLQALLAAGNIEINTDNGKIHARNIYVETSLAWSAATALTLDQELIVDKTISMNGSGSLFAYNRFQFGHNGKIQCADVSCNFNGYTSVNSLQGLASAIAANPGGGFALVHSYDASADGTYTVSPIPTNFLGALEGLNNTISNISVNNTSSCCVAGLFQSLSQAYIMDLHLQNVSVVSIAGAAGLAYESFAYIRNSTVTGSVTGGASGDVGGLIADDYGLLQYDSSAVAVSGGSNPTAVNVGGFAGVEFGAIEQSFATGNVSAGDGSGNIGGLVGLASEGGAVQDSYATGAVTGGAGLTVGGFFGKNAHTGGGIETSYSTGAVSGGNGSIVGGFIGENDGRNYISADYWDSTTSGTNIGVGLGNGSNITGMTTEQFQSGLPGGFDQKVWAEKTKINSGFPYLKSNPPPK